MNLLVRYKKLKGIIAPDSSKSEAIRFICIASQIKKMTIIKNVTFCDDINYLIKALKDVGIKIIKKRSSLIIFGDSFLKNEKILNIGDGAAPFRFLTFMLLDKLESVKITGSDRLLKRPIDDFIKLFNLEKIDIKFSNNVYEFNGMIKSSTVKINLDKSSQFASSIALVSPFSKRFNSINIKNKSISESYFLYTLDILKRFGINYNVKDGIYYIDKYDKKNSGHILENEVDYSNLCFYLFLSIKNNVFINTKINKSAQPDYKMLEILDKMGFSILKDKKGYKIFRSKIVDNLEINLYDNPDLFMPFLILGVYLNINIKYHIPSNLNYKESNRLDNMLGFLNLIEQEYIFESSKNTLRIIKTKEQNFKNLELDGKSDHRIIMSYIILSYLKEVDIKIKNFDKVSKSSPDFIKKLKKLGARFKCLKN